MNLAPNTSIAPPPATERPRARQFSANPECGYGSKTIAHAGDLIRGQPGHDYRGHHARRRPYQATTAGHGTRRGGGGHGRNVDHDGARGP